jgi:tetratricopeptide (TPR) repeat protein
MAEGEFALVRQYLEIALNKTASWVGEHDLYAMLADAAAQQRDVAALQQYAPLAEELAARYDHKLYQAIAHRAWGVAHRLAGKYAEAEVRLKQALDLFQQLATPWQIGRTLFELGEVALSRTENTAAQKHFSRALVAFEELGALPDATRTREKLAAF